MRFKMPFVCDTCNGTLLPEDGLVIWSECWDVNERYWQVTLFVVHKTEPCLGNELLNSKTFPFWCTPQEFMVSNGLREYFNLLVAGEDWSAVRIKELAPKLQLRPQLFGLSDEEFRCPSALIEAELSCRRALLKASIIDTVGRLFVDFREDQYWMPEAELRQAMREDLCGSGTPME